MKSLEDNEPTLTLVKPDRSGQLKKLNPRHKQVIQLHLQGCRLKEISEKTGLSIWWISRILNSDLARELIAEFDQVQKLEFKALQRQAFQAIKDGLNHEDIHVRLKATDRWYKFCGGQLQSEMVEVTAEDVVQAIMESRRQSPDS